MKQIKESGGTVGLIPTDTKLHANLETSPQGIVLKLSTSNFTVIKACVLYAEHLFENESHMVYCDP